MVMIESLFPPGVGACEVTRDNPLAVLFPEEAELIAGATAARQEEFRTARYCARRALADIGYPEAAIPQGPHREPIWPAGSVGSITHCEGYRAAVVARITQFSGIGIDAEPQCQLPDDVLEMVATERERSWLSSSDSPPAGGARLLFSAKESVFKAWFPMTRHWLDFKDVEIFVIWNQNRFTATLTLEAGRRLHRLKLPVDFSISGRFLVVSNLILTAAILPPSTLFI